MSKVNNKPNNFVLAVTAARSPQNQLHYHQPDQNQKEDEGKGEGKSKDMFEQSIFQSSSPVGPNLYVDVRWKPEKVKINSLVTIYALLSSPVTDKVIINIFHKINGKDKLLQTINGQMKAGRVEIEWKAQNPAKNWNQGYYFFMIIGGKANSISKNNLVLS